MDPAAQVRVDLVDADADNEEVDVLTRRLREALLELDVASVDRAPAGEAPPGSKSGAAIAAGSLLVSVATTPGVLSSIVEMIRGWLGIRASRSVKLTLGGDTIEVTGVSDARQDELIQAWLARHAAPSG
jgi:hypothetical protein